MRISAQSLFRNKMSIRQNKIFKKTVQIVTGLFIIFIGFYFLWLYPRYRVPILTYHDFGYGKGIKVTPENLERQMRYLKDKHYNVISLNELVEGIKKGNKFAHNTVVITIDDGYKDNYTYAYPVLKKYCLPATIFLISDYIGNKPNFMNWDEVREMSKSNVSFGAHTRHHVYLPSIKNKDILWYEIAGCKKVIEEHLGMPIYYFCYPSGGFTEEVKMLVKKAGYKGACTTNRSSDILINRVDMYELKRVSMRNHETSLSLWAKLSGYYKLFNKNIKRD